VNFVGKKCEVEVGFDQSRKSWKPAYPLCKKKKAAPNITYIQFAFTKEKSGNQKTDAKP
jgi:hypothetical protein